MLPLPPTMEGEYHSHRNAFFPLEHSIVSYQLGGTLGPLSAGLCWVFLEGEFLPSSLFCLSQVRGYVLLLGNFPEAETVQCVFWKGFGIVSILCMGG